MMNPIEYLKYRKTYKLIKSSSRFDSEFYLSSYPDVRKADIDPIKHFILYGAHELRKPNEDFDTRYYLHEHQDVASSALNPFYHYLKFGQNEGRNISFADSQKESSENPEDEPIEVTNEDDSERIHLDQQRFIELDSLFASYEKEPKSIEEIVSDFKEDELCVKKGKLKKILDIEVKPTQKNGVVVYTAIFGNYDELKDPLTRNEAIDYVCFTDQENVHSSVFKVIKVDKFFKNSTKNARFFKLLPHLFFPEHEYSIWIDGSSNIRGLDLCDLINNELQDHDIAAHKHFQRMCVYDEAKECIFQKKDDRKTIERQISFLKSAEYPEQAGLFETAQVIRRHSRKVKILNQIWWAVLNAHSIRDQLSFNFAAWRAGVEVKHLPHTQWLNQYFKNYLHDDTSRCVVPTEPKVNVIMLVRDALDLTRVAVESILNNTRYENYILTIVDNDSNDETKRYLSKLQERNNKVFLITNSVNESFSRANNIGADSADSEFLLFINNDIEIIQSDWLSRLVFELSNDDRIAAVGPYMLFPDYTIQSASIRFEFSPEEKMFKVPAKELREYRHSGYAEALSAGCLLVRKEIHELIGGFDDRYFYGQEDIDYCLKIRESGYSLKFASHVEVIHHESATRKFGHQTLKNRSLLKDKWQSRIEVIDKPGEEKPAKLEAFDELIRTKKLTYKNYYDLSFDISRSLASLPENIGLVVGIPRSGMTPAYIVGQLMNLPVLSIDELVANVEGFRGDRQLNISQKDEINVLIVDDSINAGRSYRKARNILPEHYRNMKCNYHFFAVYGSENWISDEVKTLHRVPLPRLFQWNYLNHGISQFSCYDLDGVLCVDPSDDANDDGVLYKEFILNAPKLYIPSYTIRAIVTSRLEKYRSQTEEWLENAGVKYRDLIMLDLPDKETRLRLNAHAPFKAEVYWSLTDTVLFYESNVGQAKRIYELTKKPVICTQNHTLFS